MALKATANLAQLLDMRMDRFDEAEELYRRAIGIRSKCLGVAHPDMASALNGDDTRPERVDTWPEKMEALSRVERAMDSGDARLTPTQRQIVKRWTDGESISGIADSLDMTPARVSDEKYKAIQKLPIKARIITREEEI